MTKSFQVKLLELWKDGQRHGRRYSSSRDVNAAADAQDVNAAERRELIRAFHKKIMARWTPNAEEIKKLKVGYPTAGFGVCDDDALEKERTDYNKRYWACLDLEQSLQWSWQMVVEVFGKDDADHAIEEEQERIGNLPYVKENV